jgi:hypothetical protein
MFEGQALGEGSRRRISMTDGGVLEGLEAIRSELS